MNHVKVFDIGIPGIVIAIRHQLSSHLAVDLPPPHAFVSVSSAVPIIAHSSLTFPKRSITFSLFNFPAESAPHLTSCFTPSVVI